MNILHITPSIAQEIGGPAKSVPALCKSLAAAGHSVSLYTTDWAHKNSKTKLSISEIKMPGLIIKIFPSEPGWYYPDLPNSKELVRAVAGTCKEFDIIDNHSLWNPVATFTMRLLRKVKANYCLTPHGMLEPVSFDRNRWKKNIWALLWERANVEGAALVQFTSISEEESSKQKGWHLHYSVVIPNIIDLEEWKQLPPRYKFEERFPQVKGREVILFVGRIHWIKNIDKLVDAMTIVKRTFPNAMLVCAGPDSDGLQANLEQRARLQIGHEHLLFTGMLRGEELKAAYSCADVFALVSRMESFGMAAAEALACGLPVVLSHGVNLGKELPDGGPVLHVAAEAEAIGEALVTLLQRSKDKGAPDAEALARAEKLFGISSVTRLIEAYSSIMRRN